MSDFDPMVPFMNARDEFEARTIVAVLEDAGLEARIFVLGNLGLPHSMGPGVTGVPVHVRRSRVAQAQRVLDESREVGASVDWESVDIGDERPTPPRRAPSMGAIARSAMIVLLAGFVTAIVAWWMNATAIVTSRAFGMALVSAFLLIVASAFIREWNDRDRGDEASTPDGSDGPP